MIDLRFGEFDGIGRTCYNAEIAAFAAFGIDDNSAMNFCHIFWVLFIVLYVKPSREALRIKIVFVVEIEDAVEHLQILYSRTIGVKSDSSPEAACSLAPL